VASTGTSPIQPNTTALITESSLRRVGRPTRSAWPFFDLFVQLTDQNTYYLVGDDTLVYKTRQKVCEQLINHCRIHERIVDFCTAAVSIARD